MRQFTNAEQTAKLIELGLQKPILQRLKRIKELWNLESIST